MLTFVNVLDDGAFLQGKVASPSPNLSAAEIEASHYQITSLKQESVKTENE
jgi:hypothetical protein